MIGPGEIDSFTLTNAHGVEIRVMTYGAILASISVPDRRGRFADIALGFDDVEGYLTRSRYLGAVVGRFGNRIAKGRFSINERAYTLATNNGDNHLHGGVRGFDKVIWKAVPFTRDGARGVALAYTSPDGEEGYPGTLHASVTYTLTPENALIVDYGATTDAPTHVNLTQHCFFNLTGEGSGDHSIDGHQLTVDADRYTPVDATQIPTGDLAPVDGTPFDFRAPETIGARVGADHPQLRISEGYDHNFVLNGTGFRLAARVVEPVSGRTLDVRTTEPGLQFYSGNRLAIAGGKGGRPYGRRAGFCLETQHFPDSPNQPHFPSTLLRPGDTYRTQTVFTFGVVP